MDGALNCSLFAFIRVLCCKVVANDAVDGGWSLNVALNRPTFASSVYVNFDPNDVGPFLTSNAVDGNHDPDAAKPGNSCFGTTNEASPWWAVDLGAALSVLGVLLTNRGDCCGNTLSFSFVFLPPDSSRPGSCDPL